MKIGVYQRNVEGERIEIRVPEGRRIIGEVWRWRQLRDLFIEAASLTPADEKGVTGFAIDLAAYAEKRHREYEAQTPREVTRNLPGLG